MKLAYKGKINRLRARKKPDDCKPAQMMTSVVNEAKKLLAPIPEQNVTIISCGTEIRAFKESVKSIDN